MRLPLAGGGVKQQARRTRVTIGCGCFYFNAGALAGVDDVVVFGATGVRRCHAFARVRRVGQRSLDHGALPLLALPERRRDRLRGQLHLRGVGGITSGRDGNVIGECN